MKINKSMVLVLMLISLLALTVAAQNVPIDKLTFDFGNENTNISFYAEINSQRILVPYEQFFNESTKFGFKINETSVEQNLTSQGINFNKKLYYKIDSSEEYFRNRVNPYMLERELNQTRKVQNQIGQLEERKVKRFIDFGEIFNKENNLYNFTIKEVNQTICYNENCTNSTTIKINQTFKENRDIGYSIIKQLNSWILEFFNIFDLDPSFIDDTDTNWNSGTMKGFKVLGTGGSANLSSNNDSGYFTSQIFDSVNTGANWTNITLTTEALYNLEIGRAMSDGNNQQLPAINTSGLVGLWHFNNETGENDSLFKDFSPDVNSERSGSANNNGTCDLANSKCPLYNQTNSKFGKYSLWFDGTNDWVNLSDVDVQNSGAGYSLELWAKHSATSFRFLVGKRDAGTTNGEWNFAINNAGNDLSFNTWVSGGTNDNLATGNVGINDNNWHHLVATFSAGDGVKKIYVDGVQVATSTTTSGTPAGTSASLMIGQVQQYYGGGLYWYNGVMDEVAIWNRTLSADEIRNLYLRGAYRLNLSARSCDDSACVGETYTLLLTNGSNNKTFMDLAKNRYFQYNITYSNESAYAVNLVINNASIEFENVSAGPDITPPVISGLTNDTTTNESVRVTWSTDENANESNNTLGLCPLFTGIFNNANATSGTSHVQFISGLINRTNYCFNTTAYDSSGNFASANFSFTTASNLATQFADESQGVTAIGTGVQNALLSGYVNYTSQQVYARSLTNSQFNGIFDWMAKKSNKVWLFNYVTSGESHVANTFNLTPSVYVLQIANLTQAQITSQVESLINATK